MSTNHQTSGILSLDYILGGGWPQGKVAELYGPKGSGCTTVALHALAAAQRAAESGALLTHSSHDHDRDYGRRLGADVFASTLHSHVELIDYAEHTLTRRDAPELMVIELGRLPDVHQQREAINRAVSKMLRHFCARRRRSTVLFVTQTGDLLPLRYYAAARVELACEGSDCDGGNVVAAKVVKLKEGHSNQQPFNVATLQLTAGDGVDLVKDLIRTAAMTGELGRLDVNQAVESLATDALARQTLTAAVRRRLFLQSLPS